MFHHGIHWTEFNSCKHWLPFNLSCSSCFPNGQSGSNLNVCAVFFPTRLFDPLFLCGVCLLVGFDPTGNETAPCGRREDHSRSTETIQREKKKVVQPSRVLSLFCFGFSSTIGTVSRRNQKKTMEEFEFGGPRVARGVPCFVFFVCVDFLCFFREQLASNGPRKHPTIIFRDQGDRPRSAAGIRSVRSAHRRRNDDRSGTKRYERKTKQTNETKWPRTFERCSVDQSPPFVFLCTISGQKRRKLLDINSTTPK